ncbi:MULTISPECIES: NUDIX hydrolase [Oceanobacillus]|uniref:NUDIX hydrolase n=1 Tax=Oceanobacillus aidingensis TaxID=645964 RepID=A0ABV9JXB2_9BACI|nr:NUDIX hydrolase [Oceanobacillus oncorhynchi]MDM8099995.1 NUDIX hydrolase [Oceanobacillus oncorhynchi]UUI40545.1 NUDIX hydrolase [Oceanobacillus oncorhynchi]
MSDKWLEWAKQIQSLAQAGLTFTNDMYDKERYEQLRTLSIEIMNEYTDHNFESIRDLFANETGYQTPKVDVRGVVFKNDRILMVREKHDDAWALPGGFCDVGESPKENVTKEILEEAGFHVEAKKLLAVFDTNKHAHPPQPYQYYKLCIQCEIISGEASLGMETKGIDFFAEDNLPNLSLNRNTEIQIKRLFEFLRDPEKPALFD